MTVKRILFALCLSLWSAVAWGASAMDKDVLLVGTESTYPPYEFRGPDGSLQGFDVDMTNRIGEILGKKIEWVDMAFDALIPSMITGRIDMISAAMSPTPERLERVAFSIPYDFSATSFLALAGTTINSLDDVAGKVVAVQLGSVPEGFARSSIKDADVKAFQKFDDCVREVILGRAFVALGDTMVARQMLDQRDFAGKVIIAFEAVTNNSGLCNALPLGDAELKAAVDAALTQMTESGELQALKEKWFR